MSIDAGNSKISQAHQQARANNDANVAKKREATETQKLESVSAFNESVKELNHVDADTIGGVIKETAGDTVDTALAGGKAVLDALDDAASDLLTSAQDKLYDTASYVVEGAEKGMNVAKNVKNGIASVGTFLFGGIKDAFEEGTNKGHNA